MCFSQAESSFSYRLPITLTVFILPVPDPRAGMPDVCQNPSLPREELHGHGISLLYCVPCQGCVSQPDSFSFLPSQLRVDLSSQPWMQRHLPTESPVCFHESCFTRRCISIIDVFMRAGELSFLLLHHVDPFPLLFCVLTKALSSAFLELIFCFVFKNQQNSTE